MSRRIEWVRPNSAIMEDRPMNTFTAGSWRRSRVGLVVIGAFLLAAAAFGMLILARVTRPNRTAGPMPHQAYVWQRVWGPEVRDSIQQAPGRFASLVVLAVEVSWDEGRPRLTATEWAPAFLARAGVPVGLAVRIGPYPGPFAEEDHVTTALCDLAAAVVEKARVGGLGVAEVQIDFDCAESKLEGYLVWAKAIRERISPTPIVITALPSWLKQTSFRSLAEATDGFVLQVHSLERPQGPEAPIKLCEPTAARRAVDRAARLGKPFRVALPTYGYLAAFDAAGRFVGLSAEGRAVSWPPDGTVIEVRSDPDVMADLVQAWTSDRPMNLAGIIWYRLPTDRDRLNWPWPTLTCVTAGRRPRANLRAEARPTERGTTNIELVNDGQAEGALNGRLRLRWIGADIAAGDALGGYGWKHEGANSVVIEAPEVGNVPMIAPGRRRTVAWLRLSAASEVRVEMDTAR